MPTPSSIKMPEKSGEPARIHIAPKPSGRGQCRRHRNRSPCKRKTSAYRPTGSTPFALAKGFRQQNMVQIFWVEWQKAKTALNAGLPTHRAASIAEFSENKRRRGGECVPVIFDGHPVFLAQNRYKWGESLLLPPSHRENAMICTRCGAYLPDNATFCTHCGNPNPSMPQPPPLPNHTPPGYAPSGYGPPSYNYGPPPGYGLTPNIPDYLVWSILTCFCCQPFGIAAIVFSVLCMGDKSNGRYDSAMKNSKMAKTMLIIGIGGWAVFAVLYIGCLIFMIVTGQADSL